MIQSLRNAVPLAPGAVKDELILVVAELTHAVDLFGKAATADNLRDITSLWARGVRLMDLSQKLRSKKKDTTPCPTLPTNANASDVTPRP